MSNVEQGHALLNKYSLALMGGNPEEVQAAHEALKEHGLRRLGNQEITRLYLDRADLPGADFENLTARNANFTEANLEGAVFYNANLENPDGAARTTFFGANLRDADFRGAQLEEVNFEEADLRGAELSLETFFQAENVEKARIDGRTNFHIERGDEFVQVVGVQIDKNGWPYADPDVTARGEQIHFSEVAGELIQGRKIRMLGQPSDANVDLGGAFNEAARDPDAPQPMSEALIAHGDTPVLGEGAPDKASTTLRNFLAGAMNALGHSTVPHREATIVAAINEHLPDGEPIAGLEDLSSAQLGGIIQDLADGGHLGHASVLREGRRSGLETLRGMLDGLENTEADQSAPVYERAEASTDGPIVVNTSNLGMTA